MTRVCDLVDNPQFWCTAPFRIKGKNGGVLYDTAGSPDMPFDLDFAVIAGIDAGTDGVLEITIE